MDVETAAALTDGLLAVVTAALAVTLARVPTRRGWAALFALMTVSATLGGLYHGFEALRTDRVWIVISGLALATGPAFLWACVLPADPSWKRRPGAWRWSTVAGFVVGGLIAVVWIVIEFKRRELQVGLEENENNPETGRRGAGDGN